MRVKPILAAVATLLLAAAGWLVLLRDPPLRPEVEAALAPPPRLAQDANLFYPLAGFDAAPGRDPAQEGYRAVSRVNALLATGSPHATEDDVTAAWVQPAAALAEPGAVPCSLHEQGCIASLRARRDEVRAAASANAELLSRYASLARFPRFQTDVLADLRTPLPRFALLLDVHRLAIADRLLAALDGNAAARRALASNVAFLRRLLRQADSLLVKMVAASMLAQALHASSAAMREGPAGEDSPGPLAPLTEDELSMDAPLRGEFRFVASGVGALVGERLLEREMNLPPWFPELLLRPLFKPNRTLEREHTCSRAVRARARRAVGGAMLPGEQAADPCPPRWRDWLLNPVGTILSSVARPDVTRYAARLRALQGLVTLVNARRALSRAQVADDRIGPWLAQRRDRFHGPFAGDALAWDAQTRTLSFASPLDTPGYDRLALDSLATRER